MPLTRLEEKWKRNGRGMEEEWKRDEAKSLPEGVLPIQMDTFVPALSRAITERYPPDKIGEYLQIVDLMSDSADELAVSLYHTPEDLRALAYDVPLIIRAYELLPLEVLPYSFEIATSELGQELLDEHASFHTEDEQQLRQMIARFRPTTQSPASYPILQWWRDLAFSPMINGRRVVLSRVQLATLLSRLEQGLIVDSPLTDIHSAIDIAARRVEFILGVDEYDEVVRELEQDGLIPSGLTPNQVSYAIAQLLLQNKDKLLAYPELLNIGNRIYQSPVSGNYQEAYRSLISLTSYRLRLLADLIGVDAESIPSYALIRAIIRKLALLSPDQVLELPYPLPRTYQLLRDVSSVVPLEEMYLPDLIKIYQSLGGELGEEPLTQRSHLLYRIKRMTTVKGVYDHWMDMLDEYPGDRVAEMLGMVVPPGMDVTDYVDDNLFDYLPAITEPGSQPISIQGKDRSQLETYLAHYRDVDLINDLAYIPYSSRRELVNGLAKLPFEETFFVSLRCDQPIAYGTLYHFQCYSEEQVIRWLNVSNGLLEVHLPSRQTLQANPLQKLADFIPALKLLRTYINNLKVSYGVSSTRMK